MTKEKPLWDVADGRKKQRLLEDIERTLFSGVEVGRNPLEKMQDAMIKLFNPGYDTRGAAGFRDFNEAYVGFTGDEGIHGDFYPQNVSEGLRACMDFTSSSFTYALQNALSMYLSKAYKSFPFYEDILISERKEAKDFRLIHSIQLGYLGDLPDIDPEAADYEAMEPYGDTESTYRVGQKGAILFVTRKHIINDSIEVVQGMVKRMARAARKAHARYVWNFYINNEDCPDGTAWFTLGHGNLGSNALDFTTVVTAITALANMTEPTPSSEKLGLDLRAFNWNLVVPIDLWDTSVGKNQAGSYYTANDLTNKVPNPIHHLFGANNERIAVCPFLTDVNDWGVIRDVEDVPIIEMSYLHGHEEPKLSMNKAKLKSTSSRVISGVTKCAMSMGALLAIIGEDIKRNCKKS